MSANSIIVTGTLNPDGTLLLDEKPKLRPGRVRVRMDAAPAAKSAADFLAVMEQVWAARRESRCPARTAAQIDEDIAALRKEFEDRMRDIERLQYGEKPIGDD